MIASLIISAVPFLDIVRNSANIVRGFMGGSPARRSVLLLVSNGSFSIKFDGFERAPPVKRMVIQAILITVALACCDTSRW